MSIHIAAYVSTVENTDIFQIFTLSKSVLRLYGKCCTAACGKLQCRKLSNDIIITPWLLQRNAGISCICYCNSLHCRCILVSFFRSSKFKALRTDGEIVYRLWFCHCKRYRNRSQCIAINIFYTDSAIVLICGKAGFRLYCK